VSDPVDMAVQPPDVLDSGEAGGKVIRGGAVRLGSYIVGMLVTLATVPLMNRHLGDDFGQFVLASSVVTIIGGLADAGLSVIAMREYALRDPAARRTLVSDILGLRIVLTVATVAITVPVMAAVGYSHAAVAGTAISGFGLLILVVGQSYSTPLTGRLAWGRLSLAETLRNALTGALVVLLVVAGAGVVPFFWISVAAGAVFTVTVYLLVRHEISPRPHLHPSAWRGLVRDALPYAAAATIGVVYFRVGIVVLGAVSDEHQTYLYGTAFKIVEAAGGVAWILVQTAFPLLSRAARDDASRLAYALARMFDVAVIAGVWFSLCTVVGAPLGIHLIAGDVPDAITVLRVQGLSLAATFLVATWSLALLSLHRYRALLSINGVALAVAIAGSAILVPLDGARGAALATVAAEVVLAVGYGIALVRFRPDLRPPLRVLPRLALATLLAVAVALLVPLSSGILVVLSSVVFFATLLLLRAIPEEILLALRSRTAG
jgi:O-antigen/teichoic acid export membrane protein